MLVCNHAWSRYCCCVFDVQGVVSVWDMHWPCCNWIMHGIDEVCRYKKTLRKLKFSASKLAQISWLTKKLHDHSNIFINSVIICLMYTVLQNVALVGQSSSKQCPKACQQFGYGLPELCCLETRLYWFCTWFPRLSLLVSCSVFGATACWRCDGEVFGVDSRSPSADGRYNFYVWKIIEWRKRKKKEMRFEWNYYESWSLKFTFVVIMIRWLFTQQHGDWGWCWTKSLVSCADRRLQTLHRLHLKGSPSADVDLKVFVADGLCTGSMEQMSF